MTHSWPPDWGFGKVNPPVTLYYYFSKGSHNSLHCRGEGVTSAWPLVLLLKG